MLPLLSLVSMGEAGGASSGAEVLRSPMLMADDPTGDGMRGGGGGGGGVAPGNGREPAPAGSDRLAALGGGGEGEGTTPGGVRIAWCRRCGAWLPACAPGPLLTTGPSP